MFKQILVNILIVIASVVIFVILAEVTFRWLGFQGRESRASAFPRHYYRNDAGLGYDIVRHSKPLVHRSSEFEYSIFSNRFGCFDYDREIPENYGLVVGDSFTWGFAPLETKWAFLLEQKTGQFLMKCGVAGYGTRQAFLKARRVVNEVGHAPRLILLMYYSNDLNDDILMPQRTVYAGHLVNSVEGLNLVTGEKFIRTPAEIERIYQKFKEGTISYWLRELRYSLVTYRLYLSAKKELERRLHALKQSVTGQRGLSQTDYVGHATAASGTDKPAMPDTMKSLYRTLLINYLDTTDRAWFTEQVNIHQKTLLEFAEFAVSLKARFIVVDINGDLTHRRFSTLMDYFSRVPEIHYFNLKADLPNPETWKQDAHWDDQGNKSVANTIFDFLKRSNLVDP